MREHRGSFGSVDPASAGSVDLTEDFSGVRSYLPPALSTLDARW